MNKAAFLLVAMLLAALHCAYALGRFSRDLGHLHSVTSNLALRMHIASLAR